VKVPTRERVLAVIVKDTEALTKAIARVADLRARREERIVWAARLPVRRGDGHPSRPSRRALAEAAGMSHGNVQHILRKRTPEEERIGSGKGARLFDRSAVKQ
jgi:hypothetical protein